MLRKDLLVRQFEEFGKVLAVILGFKMQKDWEKFERELQDATKKFTPFELGAVEHIGLDGFEKEVLGHPSMLPEQYKMLGDLLFEKMKYYLEESRESHIPELRTKCILLYKKFSENFTHNEFNMDVHYKLEFLDRLM